MVKISKRYAAAQQTADLTQRYPLEEALEILGRMPKAKFDESVEISFRLGVDPRQSNQMVRGTVELPHGSGKAVRVAVFTDKPEEALEAGAAVAGLDDLIEKIQEGFLGFDVAIATPAAMREVRKVARVLGPRGLMPNPKSGTVTDDLLDTLNAIKLGGRVEFKMDKTANVAVVVGKRSFTVEQLTGNIRTVFDTLNRIRPEGIKGRYVVGMAVSGTMTPGVKLDPAIMDAPTE